MHECFLHYDVTLHVLKEDLTAHRLERIGMDTNCRYATTALAIWLSGRRYDNVWLRARVVPGRAQLNGLS